MSFRSGGGWSSDDGQPPETASVTDKDRYQENDVLGVGGMGEVVAVDDARLQREVALKRVPLGPFSEGKTARLAREALITAGLEHPNIVPIYDAGEGADGRLFYTMRLVRGRSLAEAITNETSPLRLIPHFLDACNAIAYAHDRGIVHRDLKPANIMVGRFGETQVMDWGLAAEVGEQGGVVGTPAYMSPQQASGAPADPRDDVYSLGVVLRELASAPELVAVSERACASPEQRYTAAELASEIAAWQAGERVRAYDYTPLELLVRFVQAWRTPLVVAAAASVILAVGVGSAWRETDEKLVWALESQASTALVAGSLAEAQVLAAHALSHRESVVARGVLASRAPRPEVVVHPLTDCRRGARAGDDIVCLGSAVRLYRDDVLVWTHEALAWDVRIDGDRVFIATDEDTRALDRATGQAVLVRERFSRLGATSLAGQLMVSNGMQLSFDDAEVPIPCSDAVPALALRETQAGVAVACTDGEVATWSQGSWTSLQTGARNTIALAVEGTTTAVGTVGGEVVVLRGGQRQVHQVGTTTADLDLRGDRLAVLSEGGNVQVFDLSQEREVMRLPRAESVRFLPDGRLFATGDVPRTWTLPEVLPPSVLRADEGLSSVAFDGSGRVAAGAGNGHVLVWDQDTGRRLRDLDVSNGVVKAVEWSGGRLVVGVAAPPGLVAYSSILEPIEHPSPDRGVRRVALFDGGGVALIYSAGIFAWGGVPVDHTTFTDAASDGSRVGLLSADGGVWRYDGASLERIGEAPGAAAVAVRGMQVATARTDGVYAGDRRITELPDVLDLVFSEDGGLLIAARRDGTVEVLDAGSGGAVARLAGHEERVVHLAVDGPLLATASWDGTVRLWDLDTLRVPRDAVRAEVDRAWGLDLEDALR